MPTDSAAATSHVKRGRPFRCKNEDAFLQNPEINHRQEIPSGNLLAMI